MLFKKAKTKDYKVLSYYRVKQPNRTPSHNYEIRLDNITEEFTAEIRFSKASGDEYFINIADEPNYSLTYNYSSQSFSFEFTTKKNLRLQKFFLFKDLENNYYIRHSDSKNYLSFTPDGQKLAWGNLKRALDRMEYDENEPEIYGAIKFGSLVENVVMNEKTREFDFDDDYSYDEYEVYVYKTR